MNKALSQEMLLYFDEGELLKIVFNTQPEGKFSPIHEVIFQPNTLDGMRWRINEKPIKPEILAKEKPNIPSPPDDVPLVPDEESDG